MTSQERDETLWRFLAGAPPSEGFSAWIASDPTAADRLAELAQIECDLYDLSRRRRKERSVWLSSLAFGSLTLLLMALVFWWRTSSPPLPPGTPLIASHHPFDAEEREEIEEINRGAEVAVKGKALTVGFSGEKTEVTFLPGSLIRVQKAPDGAKVISLQEGELSARVARQIEPLSVRTPHFLLEVLGTTFDVTVDQTGSFLHVSSGTVDVLPKGKPDRMRFLQGQGWWLTESGRGVSVASAHLVPQAPHIDGVIDALWANHPPHELRHKTLPSAANTGTLADHSSFWKAVWDEDALYVLVEVTDDKAGYGASNAWGNDSTEIFVDADHSRTAQLDGIDDFLIFYEPERPFLTPGIGSVAVHPDMTHVTQRTETGFRVETRLPWASLNRAPPLPGQRIGFNVATTDHDDEPHGRERSQRTWTPKEGGDFKRSDRMGVLLLLSSSTDKDPMR